MAVRNELITSTVSSLLSEASSQYSEFTGLIERATAALGCGERSEAFRLAGEAGGRLENVKLLVGDIQDWALDDDTGFLSARIVPMVAALAAADAQYQAARAMVGIGTGTGA